MKSKLKSIFLKPKPVFSLILLGFFVFFLFSQNVKVAEAACVSSGSFFAPRNYTCDQVSLKLEVPAQAKIGTPAQFKVTLSNNLGLSQNAFPFNPLTSPKTFQVSAGSLNFYTQKVDQNFGGALSFSQTLGSPAFPKEGTYKVKVSVIFYEVLGGEQGTTSWVLESSEVNLVVAKADVGTGQANIVLTNTNKGVNALTPENVTASFSFNYAMGASGKQPTRFFYYCDLKDEKIYTGILTPEKNVFSCVYGKEPKTYNVFIKALDSTNTTIASATLGLQVTGNEQNEGAPTVGRSSNELQGIGGLINKILAAILGIVQEFIFLVFFYLIAPLIQAMLSVRVYTDEFAAVIYPGWEVVRNLSNIIFIVALIAIAIGTLLRIESYQFRPMLIQLILAALMVNFSLVIAQAILGVADTIQNQFLPNNVEVIRALAKDLMVSYRSSFLNDSITDSGYFAVTVQQLFYVALSIGSFLVFLAICVFLVIRIVMLWILLMLSPLAYAAGVLPATAGVRSEWWGTFLKYAFFTPIMAFFLNMTAVISNAQQNNPVLKRILSDSTSLGGDSNFAGFVVSVSSNILLLVFLIVALMVAEKAGIYGADAVTKIAKGGMLAPFAGAAWLGGKGAGYVGRKWNEKTAMMLEQHGEHAPPGKFKKALFAVLNPKAFAKGWQTRSEELDHIASTAAQSRGREVAEQLLTWGKLEIPYAQFAERADENNMLKEYENMKKESLMAASLKAEGLKGMEGEIRRRAIVKAAAKNGYLDDLLRMKHFAGKYATGKKNADGTISANIYDAESLNRFLFGYLGEGEQTYRMLAEDFEDLGRNTRHFEYLGHAYYDNNEKRWKRGMTGTGQKDALGHEILKNDWQANFAAGEFSKVGGRERAGLAPHNLATLSATMNEKGEFINDDGSLVLGDELDTTVQIGADELDEFQRAILQKQDAGAIRDINFSQSRLKEWLFSKDVDRKNGEIIISSESEFNKIQALYDANPDYIKALYGTAIGLEAREIKGIKIAMMGKSGKTLRTLGDADLNPIPIGNAVEEEMSKNKEIFGKVDDKLKKDGSDIIKKYAAELHQGTVKFGDLKVRMTAEFAKTGKSGVEVDSLVDRISVDLPTKVAEQIKTKYNPINVIQSIDRKFLVTRKNEGFKGFTALQIGDFAKALEGVASESFEQSVAENKAFGSDRAKMKEILKAKISSLASKSGNEVFGLIGDSEMDSIINHISPSK